VSEQLCSQVVSFFRNLFSGGQTQAADTAPAAAPEQGGLVLPPAKPGETGVARYLRALEEAEASAPPAGGE